MEIGLVAVNGIVLPLYATWFIPVAIRDAESGKFKGFSNSGFIASVFFLTWLESVFMLNEFGFSFLTVLRILGCVSVAVALGIVYVLLTNKKMFGSSFQFKN